MKEARVLEQKSHVTAQQVAPWHVLAAGLEKACLSCSVFEFCFLFSGMLDVGEVGFSYFEFGIVFYGQCIIVFRCFLYNKEFFCSH